MSIFAVSDDQNDEIEAEISIGTDIPDHEPIDDVPIEEVLSSQSIEEDPSTSSAQFHVDDNHGKPYLLFYILSNL